MNNRQIDLKEDPRSSKAIESLRYGAGSLSLDLQATIGQRLHQPIERLSGPAKLNEWLITEGIIDQPLAISDTDVMRMRDLREMLYRITYAVFVGVNPTDTDVDAVNRVARPDVPGPQMALDPTTPGRFVQSRTSELTLENAMTLVARDAVELLTSERVKHLHMCEAENCAMIFIDTSHGHRRHWCSSSRCGNRVRVAAHRARHRAQDN